MAKPETTFLEQVNEQQGILHKVCRIYRDTDQDREDLFQDMLYQLWKAWPSFQGRSKLSTWIYRIALSTAVARYRKKSLPIETGVDALAAIDRAAAKPEPQPSESLSRLRAAIQLLTPIEKAIITLYLEEQSYREMSEILDLTENHIGVKINRIKTKLKKLLIP